MLNFQDNNIILTNIENAITSTSPCAFLFTLISYISILIYDCSDTNV